jgi:hypothetical protein
VLSALSNWSVLAWLSESPLGGRGPRSSQPTASAPPR